MEKRADSSMLPTQAVYLVVLAVATEVVRRLSTIGRDTVLQWFVFAIGLLVTGVPIVASYFRRWEIAKPDEWQLLIRDGKLAGAGVGACHFRGLFDRIVRFPSSIQKVNFTVEQVTKEMQGVKVSGFALWTVHREGNGPWLAYKSLLMRDLDRNGVVDSDKGSQHIRDMCQSIIRVSVAQQTLMGCLTQRDEIRESVREQLMKQLPGWGVWLETIEISDVRVASSALFTDLQAEFRSTQRLAAERVRLTTERALMEEQVLADVESSRRRNEAEANKAIAESEQRLRREKKQAELLAATQAVQEERLAREQAMALNQLESDHAVAVRRQKNQEALEEARVAAEVAVLRKRDERLGAVSERQVQIMQIDAAKEIYGRIGTMNMTSFGGGAGDSDGPTAALLPGLVGLAKTWEVVKGATST